MLVPLTTVISVLILLAAGIPSVSNAPGKNGLCDGKIHPLIAEMSEGLQEGCVYQKLVEKYVERMIKLTEYAENSTEWKSAKSEIKKSLTKTMPNGNDKETRVSIWSMDISDLYSFVAHEINVRGFLLLSWNDDRLAWKYEDDLRDDKIKIHYTSNIWTPDIAYVLSKGSFTYAGSRETILNRNGTVFHHSGFWTRSPCTIDVSDYPNDVQHCCLDFQSTNFPKYLKMELKDGAKINVFSKLRQRYWKIKGEGSLTLTKDESNNDMIHACFDLVRPSATLQYFILLPLSSTAVLAILIPLFTNWQFQVAAKFMALLLQFLSLGLTMTDDIKDALTVPKYLKVYELLIWTTVASVSVTVIFWALTKRPQVLPPPAPLLDLVEKINPLFCGNVVQGNSGAVENGGVKSGENSAVSLDWVKVFVGLNNVFLIVFTVIYILGIIILVA